MKNFLKYVAALAIVGAFFVACSDWTDPEREKYIETCSSLSRAGGRGGLLYEGDDA